MTQRDVEITTPDGVCDATLHTPEGTGPWPAVIMFPDAGGKRPTFHEMAQRLADLGYAVLLPNVFYRVGEYEPFDMKTVFSDPAERARIMKMVEGLSKEEAARDIGAMLDFLAEQPEVAGTAVGVTGYCMGGGLALTAAGRYPDRVRAAAAFHAGRIATDAHDSPHRLAESMAAKVYVAGAIKDASFDDEQRDRLLAAFQEAEVDHTFETYEALHGFAVPDNPTYDEVAAERHWQAMADLYASTLGTA